MKDVSISQYPCISGGVDWAELGVTAGTYAAAGVVTGILIGQLLVHQPGVKTTALAALTFGVGYGLLGAVHSTLQQTYHGSSSDE